MIKMFLGLKLNIADYIFMALFLAAFIFVIVSFIMSAVAFKKSGKIKLPARKFKSITLLDEIVLGKKPVQTVYLNRTMNYSGTEYIPIPEKKPKDGKMFQFLGWDKNADDEAGKFYIKPIFLETAQKLTVNVYGITTDKPIKTFKIEYGSGIDVSDIKLEKPATDEFKYKFLGWDKDTTKFEKNESIYPLFEALPRKYTYKFIDLSGNVLFEKTSLYGTPITIPAKLKREFQGWKNYKDGMILTKNITFYPDASK